MMNITDIDVQLLRYLHAVKVATYKQIHRDIYPTYHLRSVCNRLAKLERSHLVSGSQNRMLSCGERIISVSKQGFQKLRLLHARLMSNSSLDDLLKMIIDGTSNEDAKEMLTTPLEALLPLDEMTLVQIAEEISLRFDFLFDPDLLACKPTTGAQLLIVLPLVIQAVIVSTLFEADAEELLISEKFIAQLLKDLEDLVQNIQTSEAPAPVSAAAAAAEAEAGARSGARKKLNRSSSLRTRAVLLAALKTPPLSRKKSDTDKT